MTPASGQYTTRFIIATAVTWALTATLLMTLLPAGTSASTVYRCQGPDGLVFSDRPCGIDAETVTLRDNRVGGSLADNLPELPRPPPDAPDAPPEPPLAAPESPCRYINSTDLRTYLARKQVVRGMTRDHVERAFGRTSEVYTVPQETWVYQTRYYGALYELTVVYFRDGCVERVEYRRP